MYFAVHGGTGRVCFFFEAGRGGWGFFPRRDGAVVFLFPRRDGAVVFLFPRRDGVAFFFFFDGTGRGGVFLFFSRAGTGRLFLAVAFFGGTGQNRYTVPPKAV